MSFIVVNNKRCGVQILDCTVTLKEEGYDKIVNGLFLNSLFVAVLLIYYGVPVAVLRYGKTYNKKGGHLKMSFLCQFGKRMNRGSFFSLSKPKKCLKKVIKRFFFSSSKMLRGIFAGSNM